MKRTLLLSVVLLHILANTATAQNQANTTQRNCPGVPGACGYPAQQNHSPSNPNPTPQNGNGTLGQIYNFSKCGLGFASASQRIGKRFTPQGVNQPAPFVITGIPNCAVIEQAYLWAEGSGNGAAQTATITNPASVTQSFPMTVVGSGPDKCWGYAGSYTYRASVTSIISGNGTYNISGLLTNPPTPGNDMDGATLVVIYSDPNANFRGSMVIHDGAVVVNGGTTTQTITGINACAASTFAQAFMCVGDIQFNPNSWTLNGTAAPLSWNWWNYVQVNTNVTNGQATSNFTVASSGDCYNLCVIGLYYRTNTCTTCPLSSGLTLTTTSTAANCSNCNGTATVTSVTGGTGPFTYSWAPTGGNSATATGLCAGTYTVTVSNTCMTTTAVVTVPISGGSVTTTGGQTNILCNGVCNGSATVTPTSGTSPFTYSWAPSGGTGSTATGLCAGTYTVTVTDAAGCTGTQSYTITQPPALVIAPTQTNVLCNGGCNGSATAMVSGGTPNYTYSWAPTGGNGATANGLCAGSYTCTITDANGCVATQVYTITQPSPLAATTSFTSSTCGQPNGSATVNPSGGTPTYSFVWTPSGQTTQTATGLTAGNYSVLVTDANGCTATFTVNVPNALPPVANITSVTNVNCFGACDGTATGSASGGTGPYTYSWMPSGGTGTTATGLCAGTHTFQVTDANGCIDDTIITISEPSALNATAVSTDALCFGSCNGTASVTASGGSIPYTFVWAPSGSTGASVTNLCAGTHTCTVTDANGCTFTVTVTINEPTQLTLAIAGFDASCNGVCDGQVVVIPSGGTQPFTFAWNPNVTCLSPSCSNVCAGTYTVTVTDANGCVDSANTTVNEPPALTSVMGSSTAHCNQPDGSAWVTTGGGTGPITVSWATNPIQTTDTATGLIPGVYLVTLTDANGCSRTDSVTVANAPGVVGVLAASTNVTCNGACDGTASVTASSGTAPYTYLWAPGGGTNPSASGLCQGTYTCTITDAAGCVTTVTVNITEPALLTLQAVPSTSICAGQSTLMNCTPGGGTPAYTYNWTPGNIGLQSTTLTPTTTGTYTVTVTDANGCTSTATTTVTVNPLPVAAIGSDVQSGCAPLDVNFTDASTIASPGVITSWSWDFGNGTGSTQNPFNPYGFPGSYTVTLTVTSSDGCAATITMPNYINVYPNPVAQFTAGPQPTTILSPVICFDDQSSGASSWTWSFGDFANSSSTVQEPCFTYADTGCFDVTLSVTSTNGCVDTEVVPICITPDYSLFIPNTFTPNGDGSNELFMPVANGVDLTTFEMWIFDRWGNLIYYTDDLSKGWDGRANRGSNVAQVDTYVYKIKCKDILDMKHQYIGHVNLIK